MYCTGVLQMIGVQLLVIFYSNYHPVRTLGPPNKIIKLDKKTMISRCHVVFLLTNNQ